MSANAHRASKKAWRTASRSRRLAVMKPATISVRRGKRSDATILAEIREITWRFAYTGIIPGPILDRMVAIRLDSWWRWALSVDSPISVLEYDGTLVGYATWGRCRKPKLPAKAEIYECYILPEFHGAGLGRTLFERAHTDAVRKHGAGCIVWALEANEIGCRFYEALGGKEIARTKENLGDAILEKIAYLWR